MNLNVMVFLWISVFHVKTKVLKKLSIVAFTLFRKLCIRTMLFYEEILY
jgi:hypothetical protein